MEGWRFIDSGAGDGHTNMATDLAMARLAGDVPYAATLRVYGWHPPTISLGYHQSLDDLELDQCRRDGVEVVYRPTGGRAVLHSEELTYAVVIGPGSYLFGLDIMTLYERLSHAILDALNRLHIAALFDRSQRTPQNFSRGELSSLCYASAIQHEIGVNGKKLVGSAQRRFEYAVLQHGSILLGPHHTQLARYLRHGDETWRKAVQRYMQQHTVSLDELRTPPVHYEELATALPMGFAGVLGVALTAAPLTSGEKACLEDLRQQQLQHLHARWPGRG